MAIKTQVRLAQLTGSFGDALGKINDGGINPGLENKAPLPDIGIQDLSGSLSYLATAIRRIHGGASFSDQTAGEFSQHILPSGDDTYDLGSASKAWQDLFLEGDISLTDAGTISSAAGAMTLTSAAAATWSTSAGVLTIDGAAGLTMDSDGTDPVNLGTEAVAKTITVGNVASTEVEINAIVVDINGGANGVTLNGGGPILITGTDNSGKTTIFHDNGDALAGIKLVTGGAGDEAIELDATAGGISLDADGAGKDIRLDSAGGRVELVAGEAVANAIVLDAENASGGIDLSIAGSSIVSVDANSVDVAAAATTNFDNTTDASSSTVGAVVIDGGLAVAKKAYVGTNLLLSSDSSVFSMGAGADISITHDNGTGGTLASAGAFIIDSTASTLLLDGNSGVSIAGNAAEIDITTTALVDINSGQFDIDASGAVGIDSDGVMTLGAASMNIDADGGLIDIDATTTIAVGGSNATGVTIGRLGKNVTIPGNLLVNGTATYINTSELMVEDKVVVIGIPGGMTDPGTATYALTSNVVTVTSVGHGLTNGQYVLISDPAATVLIPEAVYLITSVADVDTFTFAYSRANVSAGTAIDHSANDVTNATATGSGIMLAPGAVVETSFKWDSSDGWLVGGPASATAGLSPRVADSGALGGATKEWADLYLADASVISFGNDQDVKLTHVADTGLLLNSTMAIQFNDSSQYIKASSAADLDLAATTDINLDCTTVDVNAALDVSGASTLGGTTGVVVSAAGAVAVNNATDSTAATNGSLQTDGGLGVVKDASFGNDVMLISDAAVLNFGADSDVKLTHVADTGLLLNSTMKIQFNDATQFIQGVSGTVLGLGATDEIDLTATLVDMNANLDLDGTANISGLTTLQIGMVPDANGGAYLGTAALSWNNLFLSDGSVINWNNGNSVLTGGSALISSNVALRGLKLEVAGANDVLEMLGPDLGIIAAADMYLVANGAQIFLKGSADEPGSAWSRGSANTQYLNFSTNDASAISTDSGGFGFRNSNGTMQFKDSGGAWTTFSGDEVTESKTVKEIPVAGVVAGARVFTAGNGFDVSQIPADTNARVDCFINGQLMVSSSMVTGNGDYKLDVASGFADCDIQMQFALELDDIVSVIVR